MSDTNSPTPAAPTPAAPTPAAPTPAAPTPAQKFSPEQLQQILQALSAAAPAGAIPAASEPIKVFTQEVQDSIAAAHKELIGSIGHALGSGAVVHLRLKRIEEKLGIPFDLPTTTV